MNFEFCDIWVSQIFWTFLLSILLLFFISMKKKTLLSLGQSEENTIKMLIKLLFSLVSCPKNLYEPKTFLWKRRHDPPPRPTNPLVEVTCTIFWKYMLTDKSLSLSLWCFLQLCISRHSSLDHVTCLHLSKMVDEERVYFYHIMIIMIRNSNRR